MNIRTATKSLTLACALATLVAMPPLCFAGGKNTVGGDAFGIYSAVTRPVELDIPFTPFVELDPTGGFVYDAITLEIDNLVRSDTLEVQSFGVIDDEDGFCYVDSSATVEELHVIYTQPGVDDFIHAEVVESDSQSFGDGSEAFSAGTVTILGLTIGNPDTGESIDLGDLIDIGPNTVIDIPLVATLIINEQIPDDDSDGVTTSGLTVNALHVVDNGGLLGGEIIVASAYSRVSCSFGGGK